MKNNFLTTVITTLILLWSTGLKAQNLTVVHTTAGDFAAEAQAALDDSNQQASDIINLTITGGVAFSLIDVKILNNKTGKDDATPTIFPSLKFLDVSGVSSIAGGDNNGLCTLMTSLEEVILPNTLTQIPNSAFQGCTNLKSVRIKNQDGTLSNLFDKNNTWFTVINKYAFADCGELEIYELPSSVNNMGDNAFRNCYKLNISGIPGYTSEKSLKADLFRDCSLTDFTIPACITTIAKTALYSTNTNLQRTFTVRQTTPPTTTKPVFAANATVATNTTIKVLKSVLEAYRTAWTGTNTNDVGLNFVALTQTIAVNITGAEYGTVSYSGDGLVSPTAGNASSVEAYEGEDVTFTFAPASGAQVSISVDGETVTPEENTYTLTNVSQNGHTIEVTFTEPPKTAWTGNGTAGDWSDAGNWSNGVPNTDINIILSVTTNIPVIPETTVKTITFEQGAQADLQGSLTVTEAINVKYKIETERWYSIGFPFETGKEITVRSEAFESEGWNPLLPYKEGGYGNGYDDDYYGDFYLKEYNPASSPVFLDAEKILPGKGYIIWFPETFDDDNITFTSGPQTLSINNEELPVGENYQLVTNPALKNMELSASDGNNYYYVFNPAEKGEYKLLETGKATLAPFEAAITKRTDNPASLLSSIAVDDETITGIGGSPSINNDPAIATHYYTLQGIKITKPVENGIYIVKQRYNSGKEKVEKIIYKQK
jgi:hypothetical protein